MATSPELTEAPGEEEGSIDPNFPPDVEARFDALMKGAVIQGTVALLKVTGQHSSTVHYIAACRTPSGMVPVAYIPNGMGVARFVNMLDVLMAKGAVVESDPDYTGIKH